MTLFFIKLIKSSLLQPSKSPNSYTFSIKSNSNFNDKRAASFIAASNSGVFNSGCSINKVLNNQQPAFECRDSSLILHSTIWPTPLSKFLSLNDNKTAKELNKFTP